MPELLRRAPAEPCLRRTSAAPVGQHRRESSAWGDVTGAGTGDYTVCVRRARGPACAWDCARHRETDYSICLAEIAGDSCLNPQDEAVCAAFNLDAETEAAGLSCTGNATCISQALQTDTGLSAGCADCCGSVGGCAASNCALQCLGGSGSSGCRNCVASNCAQEFEVCSGWRYGQQ